MEHYQSRHEDAEHWAHGIIGKSHNIMRHELVAYTDLLDWKFCFRNSLHTTGRVAHVLAPGTSYKYETSASRSARSVRSAPPTLLCQWQRRHEHFRDLTFTAHANVKNAVQSRLDLGNGIEISVVSMKGESSGFGNLYGNASVGTYEVAAFRANEMLPLSPWDDVVGWQTEAEITALMRKLQGKDNDIHTFIDQLHLSKSELKADLT